MIKKVAHGLALSFALTVLLAPGTRLQAQSSGVVTGSDPEPTGEPTSNAMPVDPLDDPSNDPSNGPSIVTFVTFELA